MHASKLARRRPHPASTDLCTAFCSLYIAVRGLSTTSAHLAAGSSNNATPNPMHSAPPGTTKREDQLPGRVQIPRRRQALVDSSKNTQPSTLPMPTPQQRAAEAEKKARDAWDAQQAKVQRGQRMGSLAPDSVFVDEQLTAATESVDRDTMTRDDVDLSKRSPLNMAARLDPNPNARARWARKMVIRHVRRRGRLTQEMRIARSERAHTSKSRFFKTSVKKLAPLARQIAGKPIDDAILQMRFSKKKAAKEVLKHLVQAKNEAVVMRGMGLSDHNTPTETFAKLDYKSNLSVRELIEAVVNERQTVDEKGQLINKSRNISLDSSVYENAYAVQESVVSDVTQSTHALNQVTPEITDASNTTPLFTQTPGKALKKDIDPSPTDIYIAQAWVNRGKYGQEPSPRARGRMDVLRLPHTGISVMLKEEKTRTREKRDKELKAIRKRLNGKLWTQLPDRPIPRQSQYILW